MCEIGGGGGGEMGSSMNVTIYRVDNKIRLVSVTSLIAD